jgi:hypothetical protein
VFILRKEFWKNFSGEIRSFKENHLIEYGTNGADDAIKLHLTKLGGDFLKKYNPKARNKIEWGIPIY